MPNLPRYSLLTIAVFAAMVIAAAQNPPVPTTKSTTTFTEMKSLVGEWEAVQDGVTVKETYALTANGSVLMAETRTPSLNTAARTGTLLLITKGPLDSAPIATVGSLPSIV